MSSTDVFMSSPHRPRTLDPISISSSSPYLPSLDEIFLKKSPRKSPFRTVNHAAPIPPNAQATFTSAADVLREAPEIDIDTETITSSPPRRVKTTARNLRQRVLAPDDLLNHQNSNTAAIGSLSPKDKPWQKFKRKPSTEPDDQPQSPTRPKASSSRKRSNNTKETVSRHFTTRDEDSLPKTSAKRGKGKATKKETVDEPLADLPLELAVPRRGDWTPPRSTEAVVLDSDSDARELFSSIDREKASKHVFQTLYTQYGRNEIDLVPEPSPQPQTEVFRKRMRIELISTGQGEREQSSQEPDSKVSEQSKEQKRRAEPKTPAPRKKTRTITELATAPFAAPPAPEFEFVGPTTKESMLDYFDSDGAVKALVEHQSAVMSQRNPKAKETKAASKTRKKKAGTQANPILLSPNSALKQSSNQDFVFGTSSQLMQEESPTTLRDLQAAIRVSNSLNSDPFDDDAGQRLWHAGARDEDGELMGMELIDLQHSPAVVAEPTSTATPGGRSFVDINDILNSPMPVSSTAGGSSETTQASSHFFQSQGTEQQSGPTSSESEGSTNPPSIEPRPKYELFTDAQLSKQITSYGFKPVKKRAAMIALLDHCWVSKHQGVSTTSVQPLSTSTRNTTQESVTTAPSKATTKPRARGRPKKDDDTVIPVAKPSLSDKPSPKRSRSGVKNKETTSTRTEESSISVPSPKRPRGRPRKSSNTSIEIPDSDNGASSPASSPDPVFSSPPPLDLTISDEGDMSLTISPTDQQAELFKHITKAVISTPRSQDPSNPSWHEKMLLYDPIILEELASWLNGGELTRVGYDGEVSPFEVKKWCESKSVICLWRQNIKGKERKRY
ncbi:hypothetical protein GGR51DRAFT_543014 [Nemania sp. FL0031]|nr:hypothetical protein GGR51DRAFT_543014 [Nemania sp. FL0031]